MVAIKRRDTGQWAIPGGMVDAGEKTSMTVKREFMEEATAVGNKARKERNKKLIDELFASADGDETNVVYRGYVDDPRVRLPTYLLTYLPLECVSPHDCAPEARILNGCDPVHGLVNPPLLLPDH